MRVGILRTETCMDVQVLETMNLIVGLDITREVVGIGECLLEVQQGNRVLRSIRVRGVSPSRISERRCVDGLIVTVEEAVCRVV